MMSWLRRNWRSVAGALCGASSVAVGIAVNPVAGLALGTVCTAAFGHAATKSRELAQGFFDATATPEQRRKLLDTLLAGDKKKAGK